MFCHEPSLGTGAKYRMKSILVTVRSSSELGESWAISVEQPIKDTSQKWKLFTLINSWEHKQECKARENTDCSCLPPTKWHTGRGSVDQRRCRIISLFGALNKGLWPCDGPWHGRWGWRGRLAVEKYWVLSQSGQVYSKVPPLSLTRIRRSQQRQLNKKHLSPRPQIKTPRIEGPERRLQTCARACLS